jgi:hypothetical protein
MEPLKFVTVFRPTRVRNQSPFWATQIQPTSSKPIIQDILFKYYPST